MSVAPGLAAPAGRNLPQAQVLTAINHDVSPALRSMPALPPSAGATELENWPRLPAGDTSNVDAIVQRVAGPNAMPPTIQNFDGLNNVNGMTPPDITGAVGPNHFVQWINLSFQVFDKSGHSLYGPANGNTLFQGFGTACGSTNNGDPTVLYDQLADRWLMSQFALPNFPAGPFYQCIAVSTSGDPLGTYNRYEFHMSDTLFHDPPKFAVWPDGYYMTANLLNGNNFSWAGVGVYAFDRTAMLAGAPAGAQGFTLPATDWGNLLPASVDGAAPPAGSPNYMLEVVDDGWDPGNLTDELQLHKFHVDWSNPANSTFNTEPVHIPVSAFDGVLCSFQRNCVPQMSSMRRLDALGGPLMYRLQYRNFGTHESLVVNHTVDVGNNVTGLPWYELRDPNGAATVYQQGTYAPNDGVYRWLGGIALDAAGNMGLAFSASGPTMDPSIHYTGRLAGDAPGTMTQGEGVIVAGTGAQTSTASRWGDYATMVVDPSDGCTFWFMSEYIQTTGQNTWQTRIASFRFPSCVNTPTAVQTSGVNATSNSSLPLVAIALASLLLAAIAFAVVRVRRTA